MSHELVSTAAPNELVVKARAARESLESASVDGLIAVRAWCEAVADAAKQQAIAEVALEAAETRAHAEYRLGKVIRAGGGADLKVKSRGDLEKLAELSQEQFEETMADLKARRQGDQILLFRPMTIFRRAQRLFSEEVEEGIRCDFRGFYNGWPTLAEARRARRHDELERLRMKRFVEKLDVERARKKPEIIKLDEALSRSRRLAQSVSLMSGFDYGGPRARHHLGNAESFLGRAAQELHLALQSAVLEENAA